jgi:outer membrane PBP1 activator LpoA protein
MPSASGIVIQEKGDMHMLKRPGILLIAFIFILSTTISATFAADTIKVGIILPLTGKHAKFGEIEKQSFELALEEINSKGGVKGKKIELIIEDTTGKPDVGRSAVEKLITQDKVVMLGGGYSSSVTYAAAGVALNKGFPFLVNTGSADKITEPSSFTPSGQRANNLKKKLKKETDPAKKASLKKKIAKLEERAAKEAERLIWSVLPYSDSIHLSANMQVDSKGSSVRW